MSYSPNWISDRTSGIECVSGRGNLVRTLGRSRAHTLFPIVVVKEGGRLFAKAHFVEKHEYLSREIRCWKWLGYNRDIP